MAGTRAPWSPPQAALRLFPSSQCSQPGAGCPVGVHKKGGVPRAASTSPNGAEPGTPSLGTWFHPSQPGSSLGLRSPLVLRCCFPAFSQLDEQPGDALGASHP